MKQTIAVGRGEGRVSVLLLWCGMGLLVPRAALFGVLAPFGIGMAACSAAANLPVLLSIGIGYLLAQPVLLPLRYVAAVALVAGGRWVLEALPDGGRQPFVPPLLAFVAGAATGLVGLVNGGGDGYRILLVLTESAVAAGAALFFDVAMHWSVQPRFPLTTGHQAALCAVAAVAVSAAATVEVGGFSPGRAVAALLVLVCARVGREGGGCVAGCVLGGALALTSPTATHMALALAFGGLLAGVFSRYGRVAQTAAFVPGAALITLTHTQEGLWMLLYELFCAGVLFCCLPTAWERKLSHPLLRRRELPAVEGVRRMTALRLQVACGALEEVSQSVEEVSRRLSHHGVGDLASLYRGCATAVCVGCPMGGVCWGLQREDTLAGLETLTPQLRQTGQVAATDLQGLPVTCRRGEALAGHLTHGYAQYVAQEAAWSRLEEIRRGVEQQLGGVVSLLEGLSRHLQDPHGVDMELSEQVLTVCEDCGMAVAEALCTRDQRGRLTVSILLDKDKDLPRGRWLARMEQACGCVLTPPAVARWGDCTRVQLTQRPRYRVERGVAQHVCCGESLCGDAARVEQVGGCVVALISDGMGCGGRAAVDSAMAAGIALRLWQAEFVPAAIVQTVNAALLVKSREESLATLDVAVVDLHTGGLELYKAGAAPTLLRSGTRVSRLEDTGLPLGILPRGEFTRSRDTLSQGDVLLLMSDGALGSGLAAVEECLRDFPQGESMQTLAQRVADLAREGEGAHSDDITVVALRLCREGETEEDV